MEQIKLPPEMIIDVEFRGAAAALKPVVFRDGDSFCCLLGPDPQSGVFGCGSTPDEAIQDWDDHLKERLRAGESDDEVVRHVKRVIFSNPETRARQLKEFEEQFRPLKKKPKP